MQNPSKPLIYLASASPRRSALLHQIGVEHRICPVNADERARPGESPARYVQRLAALKADTLWSMLEAGSMPATGPGLAPGQRYAVLGADTAVVVEAEILGKPADEEDCVRMLRRLSGRTHQVYTAVALRHAGGCDVRLSVSDVGFRKLDAAQIRAYWRSGEPADKAGGYGIQGMAARFIERIVGSYSGIVGLPLYETSELLALLDAPRVRHEPPSGDIAVNEAAHGEVQG